MALSYTGNIAIAAPTQVVQALLVHKYAPEHNPTTREIDVRPFGVSVVTAAKDQVIRFDFDIRANGGGTALAESVTFVEGQTTGSWLLARPFIKRTVRQSLEELKRDAEAEVAA
jgi:hypothetical protein